MRKHIPTARSRGMATLAVAILLLFTSTVVVFYMNRGVIFEQKTSANQVRSTQAFEVAEAGIEWATGMLNRPYDIQESDCSLLSSSIVSFRRKYIQTGFSGGNSNVAVTTTTFPGCKVNGSTLYCNCPNIPGTGEAVANPTVPAGTPDLPSFTVTFAAVTDPVTATFDPTSVRVTSTGCTAQAGMCKPTTATASTTGNSDATATVSVILKLAPTLRAAPSAALTCGTSCAVGGAYTIRNTEVASNGYLVNAGTTISSSPYAASHYETIPGQPVENALISSDSSLSALSSADPTCSAAGMFRAFFGSTLAQYAASPDTISITCNNPSTCGSMVNTAYNDGWRNFYFPSGFALNNSAPFSTLGGTSPGDGVNLVSPGDIDINGNITINGLLFSNSNNTNDLGTGTANINGAIVACAGYNNNGSGVLNYNSNSLGGTGLRPGVMVRVPGSWRDF